MSGLFGSVSVGSTAPSPFVSSLPSVIPSSSVSWSLGLVFVVGLISGTNKLSSVSAPCGVVKPISVPSKIPSLSVSGLFGSVPSGVVGSPSSPKYSLPSVIPSLSVSSSCGLVIPPLGSAGVTGLLLPEISS